MDNSPEGMPFLFMLAFYFLPAIVAYCRRHANKGAILALNLLLGWSILGWIIAFVWSCTNNVRKVKLVSE